MNISEIFWNRMSRKIENPPGDYEKRRIRIVEKIKNDRHPDDAVLDYGCGTGSIACALAGRVKEIHGIDFSAKMVEIARRKAKQHNRTNIDFSKATIFDPTLMNATFDVVLAVGVLHLLKDPRKEIQRINELLKPEGLFFLSLPAWKKIIRSSAGSAVPRSFLEKSELRRFEDSSDSPSWSDP